MVVVDFIITFVASLLGSVSGLGGGVIIKPLMDLLGWYSISAVSFMSGVTVLSMSMITVYNSRKTGAAIEKRKSGWLAVGSVLGGLSGKYLFDLAKQRFPQEQMVGLIQSVVLIVIIVFVFLSMRNWERVTCKQVEHTLVIVCAGLVLGLLASFLGIGGGPLNVVLLMYLFSMDPKAAAINSIYIVLFSQATSLLFTVLSGTVPSIPVVALLMMCAGGICGGFVGSHLSGKLSSKQVLQVFNGIMLLVIAVNLCNIARYSMAL